MKKYSFSNTPGTDCKNKEKFRSHPELKLNRSLPVDDELQKVLSLLKNKIDSQNQETKTYQVIHPESFIFEYNQSEESKNDQGDNFLEDFQLP